MIFLQKSWGLPVTCRSQSVNPAVTYFAFLHNSRVMILLIIVNLGARLCAPHFTVHFSIQKPVSSQQICWKYSSRCFDFFAKKVGVCRLLVVVNQLTRLLPILRFCTVVAVIFYSFGILGLIFDFCYISVLSYPLFWKWHSRNIDTKCVDHFDRDLCIFEGQVNK